jgi:hypothetical protein
MNMTLEDIKVAVAKLPDQDRADLAEYLLASLQEPDDDAEKPRMARSHKAFLNGYVDADEGLYDDDPSR